MRKTDSLSFEFGFKDAERPQVALLYDEAFGAKLGIGIPSPPQRQAFLARAFSPDYAIVARANGEVVGLAGFHTATGSLTGGVTYRDLIRQLGIWGGNRAALLFSLFERQPAPRELLMDGIAVNGRFRGQGIGGELLNQLIRYGKEQGYTHIRLDVIDTNPRARQLYQRKGFVPTQTDRYPYLRWLLGFGSSTTMIYPLSTD